MDGVMALDKLRDHYKHCIRLSASNKINQKNAFDLQLIDFMQDLVSRSEDGQMNFKIASSALDVGAKIYSNRVDFIQSEAQKVASSLLIALDGQQNSAGNDDTSALDDSNTEEQEFRDGAKKKKPNRTKNVKTVVEDTNLLDAKLEKTVLGDVYLDGLSQEFDISCPAALISYNALTQPNCLLTIESSHSRIDYRDISIPRPQIDIVPSEQCNFVTLIAKNVNCAQIIRNNQNSQICPRLEKFLFNDRTTAIPGITNNDELNTSGAHEFNPELYAKDDHSFDDHCDADSVTDDIENRPEEPIPNLNQIASSKPTDYVYSEEHHRLLNIWAGPHAWKAVKVAQSVRKENPRKRIKLEQNPIDFNENYSEDLEKMKDKEIRHSADIIRRWKKPPRPQDFNLNEETVEKMLVNTFTKPEDTYNCTKTPAEASIVVGIDHDYSRDTPNSPGGLALSDDESVDEFRADPVVDGFGAPMNDSQQHDLEFAGENLIEQPFLVAQVNIPFAKVAKKMDVRRLKRVIWDLLPEKVDQDTSSIHKEFSNVYTELPSLVSTRMANDLSQPIAFVTLLHLANEKNLKLTPNSDLNDFIIEQD